MANETELSNLATPSDVISDASSAALVQAVVALPHVYMEDLPANTNVKLFRKDGSLAAEALTESTSYTFSANSELSESTITSTATAFGVVTKLTIHAQQFAQNSMSKIVAEQGRAIARDLDDEVLALADNFSNQVTASSTLTAADALEAIYTVRSSTAGVSQLPLVALLDYKGVNELLKEINASAASLYSQPSKTTLLDGIAGGNGFRGTLPGLAIYETDGLPTSGGDDVGLVFDPNLAFAGMASPSVQTRVVWEGSGGFWDEISSYIFFDVVEWNDAAGCGLLSDT